MTYQIQQCIVACQREERCETFVYYTKEMMGTCILCADMEEFEPTPHQVRVRSHRASVAARVGAACAAAPLAVGVGGLALGGRRARCVCRCVGVS
eukprot:803947-Prymnesium_polylepis.1